MDYREQLIECLENIPKILRSLGYTNVEDIKDTAQDFALKFLEKGYIEKYDPKIAKPFSYVFGFVKIRSIGRLQRFARDKLRHAVSIFDEAINIPIKDKNFIDTHSSDNEIEFYLQCEKIRDDLREYGVWSTCEKDGKVIERSLLQLFNLIILGCNREEIRQYFNVSNTTVTNMLQQLRTVKSVKHLKEIYAESSTNY